MPFGHYTLARIQSLQPAIQPIIQMFLEQCAAAGIPCDLVTGARSFETQAATYAQGRSTPGPIVTNAPPGDSYHQYGLAVDVVPVAYKGLPNWNPGGPLWAQIGAIGERAGLTWGGRWSTPDRPHFEFRAAPLAELKAYWEKFKQIMPVTITPTTGGLAIILMIGLAWFFLVKPQLKKARMI